VKASTKRLLAHLHNKLVLDWRRKAATMASVRTEIGDVLDASRPADAYPPELFDAKVQAVSTTSRQPTATTRQAFTRDSPRLSQTQARWPHHPTWPFIAEVVVECIRVDAEFASLLAAQLGVVGGTALRTIPELIDNDEDCAVEFKSTARWDVRENQPSKAMEDAVVKTVAGFLNTDGRTLLRGRPGSVSAPIARWSVSTSTTRG
jgi:type I restriction enzyme, R subunit